jgi:RNA polymerase sigma-70 factor, ECF subfamily
MRPGTATALDAPAEPSARGASLVSVSSPPAPSAEERLGAMVAEHFDLVWRLLRRLGVPAGAVEDAAQEVFMVAARRVDEIRPGSEKSYLYGTTLRIARGVRRRSARELARSATFDDDLAAPGESPEQLLEQRRKLAFLDELLDVLEGRERVVFVLFELEGLTLTEISELLQIPRGTVASRLRRARRRFVRAIRARAP